MMNRAGIGSLMRAGPAPGRAGLSHLGRGEMVLPNRAMQADPSLRQRAMQSMAMQGRNPMQYTVGGQNSRNPMTGRPEFADMVYTENGWVDPNTGRPMDFGGGDSFANTGTNVNYSGPTNFDPVTGQVRVASFGGLPSIAGQQIGNVLEFSALTPEQQGFVTGFGSPEQRSIAELAKPFQQAAAQGITATPGMALNPIQGTNPYAPFQPAGANQYQNAMATTPPAQNPSLGAFSDPAADLSGFTTPQTYDQWRDTRNPTGKGVPNVLFGQTQQAGSDSGVTGMQMQTPNVLAGQLTTGSQWGTPGTAGGMARQNSANDPSILRSGYSDPNLSQSIYGSAFGNNSGIAFSGGGQNPYGQQQQAQQQPNNYGFGQAFGY